MCLELPEAGIRGLNIALNVMHKKRAASRPA